MKIPTQLTTKDKFKYLSRVAELLRLEHNKKGADFKGGKITEKEFRNYQRNDFDGRFKNVLHEINKIKEAEGITRGDPEKLTEKQIEFRQLEQSGKTEKKWDTEIDIKTIEKAGRGIKIFDPIEDFETYTSVDPDSAITVIASKVSWSDLKRGAEAYVYKDKGIDHFDGDFEHLLTSRFISADARGAGNLWVMANTIDSYVGMHGNDADAFFLPTYRTGSDYRYFLRELDSGTTYTSTLWNSVVNTIYYLKIARDESVGTYGTIYCYIYNDSDRTDLETTLSVTLHTCKKNFRYIYAVQAQDQATDPDDGHTGYIENLDLQEAAEEQVVGPFPTFIR